MNVLLVNARYAPEGLAGPAFTTQFLAEELVRQGHRPVVFCRTSSPGVRLETMRGVHVVRLGAGADDERTLGLLRDVAAQHRVDVIHSVFPRETALESIRLVADETGAALVQSLLAFFLLCGRGELMRDGVPCARQCDECAVITAPRRRFAGRVDAAVGISRYMLELHQRWGLFGDTAVTEVIHDAYVPPATALPEAATSSAEAGAPLRLGFLGRLEPHKGLDRLLDVLTGPLRDAAWELVVGGQGPAAYERHLRTTYAHPRVRFVGFVEPWQVLHAVDLLVVPSTWAEPLARVVLEAFGHGVPVLASRRGGLPEAVGDAGWLFDPDRPAELAERLLTLLADRAAVAEAARAAAREHAARFTPQVITSAYAAVYERAVAARRSAGLAPRSA